MVSVAHPMPPAIVWLKFIQRPIKNHGSHFCLSHTEVMAAARLLLNLSCNRALPLSESSPPLPCASASSLLFGGRGLTKRCKASGHKATVLPRVSPVTNAGIVPADSDDGVSLGTMKLPQNIDIPRFETLLFQWANSLCQGANLPLPVPLKVDKIQGGARLGFVEIIDEGKTDMSVYIDCLVFPAPDGSGPIFRATRNGRLKEREPPGEPRIMRSLLEALQKSVEIARI